MAIKATMEILGTRMWDMSPDILHHYKSTVDRNLVLHAHFDKDESEAGLPYMSSMADGFISKHFVGKATQIRYWEDLGWESGDAVISVLPVTGPILRSGDACSYGSKQYRDFMMAASNVPGCVGHLVYIDTPGGSAYAKNDFKYAIDYVRAKGQKVIALVDGLCASAGMALASMCDEIYFMNSMDRIGSIGTMCAFYATPDGVVDAVTQERFIEVYGSKSEYKNKEYRDAASGNYEELQQEVDALNEEFWDVVKTYRPQVLEEQMHGKVYNCGDVIGTLVDGQGTMQSCINRILELAGVQSAPATSGNGGEAGSAASDIHHSVSEEVMGSIEETATQAAGESIQLQDASVTAEVLEPIAGGSVTETQVGSSEQDNTETIQTTHKPEGETTNEPVVPKSSEEVPASQTEEKQMKEYPLIMSALGVNALVVDKENGYYMNETLCDAMESYLAQAGQDKMTLDAKMQEVALLNAKIEELRNEHEQAIKALGEAHNQEIEKLNNEHAEAIKAMEEKKDGEIASLNDQLNESKSTIEGLNEQVEQKEEELEELSQAVAEPVVPSAPTADGVKVVQTVENQGWSAIDDTMTPEEKKKALLARSKMLAKLIG